LAVVSSQTRGGIHGAEIRQIEPVQEILLDVAHAPLDPALLVAFPDTTGGDGKAAVMREVQVPRVEHRRLTDQVFEHRRLQIIDHDLRGYSLKRLEGMLVTGKKMLHGLRDGELEVHEPAVTEDHHEEAQTPPSRADRDRAVLAPVDLCGFPGGEGEGQEGGGSPRPHPADVVFYDRIAPWITHLSQPL
jgi:hypothetical protein